MPPCRLWPSPVNFLYALEHARLKEQADMSVCLVVIFCKLVAFFGGSRCFVRGLKASSMA